MSGPFASGDRVLLVDQRGRHYLVKIHTAGTYHTHSGTLPHDELIGKPEGTRVETSAGMVLIAFRPRFADYVLKMPRGAQVVYPKDLGPIMTYADIRPGHRVIEAGTGSGALTAALLHAVGHEGLVVSYDLREEHAAQGAANLEGLFGELPSQLELRAGDIADVPRSERYDRCVLDLPEPWAALSALHDVLEPGGVVCTYLPTILQVQQTVLAFPEHGFLHVETFEVLRRGWHVTQRSVRPDHRMVGHTGFLSVARRLADE